MKLILKTTSLAVVCLSLCEFAAYAGVTLDGANFNSTLANGSIGSLSEFNLPNNDYQLILNANKGLTLNFGSQLFAGPSISSNITDLSVGAWMGNLDLISGTGSVKISSGGDLIIQTHDVLDYGGTPGQTPSNVVVNATKNIINADVEVNGGLTVNGARVVTQSGNNSIDLGSNNSVYSGSNVLTVGQNNHHGHLDHSIVVGSSNSFSDTSRSLFVGSNLFSGGSYNALIVGEYNDDSNTIPQLFSVGNGTATQRSNAFEVHRDGKVKVEDILEVGDSIFLGEGLESEDSRGDDWMVIGNNNNIVANRSLIVGEGNRIYESENVTLLGKGLDGSQNSTHVGVYNKGTALFSVGNGTGPEYANRSNAFEVHQNGKVVMTGDVILEKVQGDISMGIFGE